MPLPLQTLLDALAHLLDEAVEPTETGPDGEAMAELFVQDERFLLVHTDAQSDEFMVYAEFGEVPQDQALACLQRILEINLAQAGQGRAGFGLAPGGQRLVYAIGASLARTTPSALVRALVHMAEQIKAWRRDHFLGEAQGLPHVGVGLIRV